MSVVVVLGEGSVRAGCLSCSSPSRSSHFNQHQRAHTAPQLSPPIHLLPAPSPSTTIAVLSPALSPLRSGSSSRAPRSAARPARPLSDPKQPATSSTSSSDFPMSCTSPSLPALVLGPGFAAYARPLGRVAPGRALALVFAAQRDSSRSSQPWSTSTGFTSRAAGLCLAQAHDRIFALALRALELSGWAACSWPLRSGWPFAPRAVESRLRTQVGLVTRPSPGNPTVHTAPARYSTRYYLCLTGLELG